MQNDMTERFMPGRTAECEVRYRDEQAARQGRARSAYLECRASGGSKAAAKTAAQTATAAAAATQCRPYVKQARGSITDPDASSCDTRLSHLCSW